MLDAHEVLARLDATQRSRLQFLLGKRRGAPRQDGDSQLSEMRLVYIRRVERGPDMTELNNDGWAVAMLIGDPHA